MSSYWLYYLLWIVVDFAVPRRKEQKGYIWRAVRATLFRWFFIKKPPEQLFRRFMVFSAIVYYGVLLQLPLSDFQTGALFFAFFTVLALDDYLNGDDDDRKKRWDWVRNKIRWLMELPAKPQEEPAAGS